MESARVVAEVTAGLVPGQPMDEYTKRWAITSEEWRAEDGKNQPDLLFRCNGQAQAYAAYLMFQPDRVNWVRTDWIYL